jgi:hypothetical protein
LFLRSEVLAYGRVFIFAIAIVPVFDRRDLPDLCQQVNEMAGCPERTALISAGWFSDRHRP